MDNAPQQQPLNNPNQEQPDYAKRRKQLANLFALCFCGTAMYICSYRRDMIKDMLIHYIAPYIVSPPIETFGELVTEIRKYCTSRRLPLMSNSKEISKKVYSFLGECKAAQSLMPSSENALTFREDNTSSSNATVLYNFVDYIERMALPPNDFSKYPTSMLARYEVDFGNFLTNYSLIPPSIRSTCPPLFNSSDAFTLHTYKEASTNEQALGYLFQQTIGKAAAYIVRATPSNTAANNPYPLLTNFMSPAVIEPLTRFHHIVKNCSLLFKGTPIQFSKRNK